MTEKVEPPKPPERDPEAGPTEVARRSDEQARYQQQRPLAQPPGFYWGAK